VLKMLCKSCGKEIDSDSIFCKYCGENARAKQENLETDKKLVEIFQAVRSTLQKNSAYSDLEFKNYFEPFMHYENRVLSDNEYFRLLVDVIFYSGFKASTVNKYLERIHTHFSNYSIVSNYSSEDIETIKNDPDMIQNKKKIDACIKNAKKFTELIETYGSIRDYIESYHPSTDDTALYKLKKNLESNFTFLGGVTSYHFMTDIGLNVLKPDRVILRIFKRLGLIESDNDFQGAVRTGRAFSGANKLPIRYIDIVFVLYGQIDQKYFEGICLEKNPKCNKCGIASKCLYAKGIQ